MNFTCLKVLYLYIFLITIVAVNGDILQGRYNSACCISGHKIYCFFGAHTTDGDSITNLGRAIGEIVKLDLTKTYNNNGWTSINNRYYRTDGSMLSSIVPVTGQRCVIDGGYNAENPITNVTKIFSGGGGEDEYFNTHPNDGRNLLDPIYYGTAVYHPLQGQVYYWGGLTGAYPGRSVNLVTILPISTYTHRWENNNSSLISNINPRFGHTASLEEKGNNIFYIGGKTRKNPYANVTTLDPSTDEEFVPFLSVLVYNTETSMWSINTAKCNGPAPSSRFMHTATTIPNTTQVIIYGGANRQTGLDKTVPDYLYYFDTSTYTFEKKAEKGNQKPGPRHSHSAVYYGNTLFVLFGINADGYQTNDVFFMNTDRAEWLATYPEADSNSNNQKKMMIIGVSIGSFFAVAFLVLGIVWFYRRQKKIKQKRSNEDLPKLHKEYQRYSEISVENLYSTSDGGASGLPRYADISKDNTTVHDSTNPPYGFNHDNVVIPSSAIVIQKPNEARDQPRPSIAASLGSRSLLSSRPTSPNNLVIKPSSNE